MSFAIKTAISLAPGFSPVWAGCADRSRFDGFRALPEAAEAAATVWRPQITGLKPGANERKIRQCDFANTP
jgi:hypothetical protein